MKKIGLFAAILLAVLALASCYWRPDFSSGGISLDVSGVAPKAVGDVVRVYLIADGLLFSTGGGVPFAAEISGEDTSEKVISIKGLPVGPIYKAMAGWGPVSGGAFQPTFYGESKPFKITPNADTAVIVNTVWVPLYNQISFSPDLLGHKLTGIVDEDYGNMYAAEAGRLHYFYFSPYTWSIYESYDLAGYQINGLSKGDPNLNALYSNYYLNTDNGILPFQRSEGWYFDEAFGAGLGGSRDIRGSASFPVPGTDIDYAVFFRRLGGLGGTYVPSADTSNPSSWIWLNQNVDGVSDMTVSRYNAYYAADGAVFAIAPAYLQNPTLAENRLDLSVSVPVQSLGFRPYISGGAGGTLYLGTTDGVWQMNVDESATSPFASPVPEPVQVAGTESDSIERVAINGYTTYHEAYLSRYYLYVVKSGSLYCKIPFFAVVPGRATGMAWDSSWTLYIAGTEGLSAIYIGS